MSSFWVIQVALNPMISVLTGDAQKRRRRREGRRQAEAGVE